jgi:Tol biopolymer transport system component
MAETMTAILKEEPAELSASNPNISPALERIVNRCLEKKPERRFQSTADLGFALDALSAPTGSSGRDLTSAASLAVTRAKKSTWRERLPWIVAGLFALLAAAGFGLWRLNRPATSERAIWLAFSPPPGLAFNDRKYDYAVISPDGQKIAFTAFSAEGKNLLYLADLNSPDAKPLPGTDDALEPFWSPDSKSIAFGSLGKLKRVDVAGGNSKVICDAARLTGGAWSKTGSIVFGPDYGQPIFKVSAGGGEPEQVTFKDDETSTHRFPSFLPDGRHFVFTRQAAGKWGIWSGSLDSREVKQVLPEQSFGIYANGRLIYVRNQVLVSQEFDPNSLQLSGDAAPITTGPVVNATGQIRVSVSDTGVLIYQGQWEREYQLIWFDREGKQAGTIGKPELRRTGQEPHISPDGKRLLFKRDGIWTSDLNGENAIKLGGSQLPAWSPDGNRVVFNGNLQGKSGIVERAANGVGEPVLLLEGAVFANDISPDGRFLFYMHRGVKTRGDIWALPRFGDGKPFPILATAADEQESELSPDGKWLAYTSDESGSYEVYVQSFTAEGKLGTDRIRVSTNGGIIPNWSSDGKELFYVDGDGRMITVPVNASGGSFQKGAQTALFQTRMFGDADVFHEFAVSHDGQRFLVGTLIGDTKSPRPTVVLNWTAALKK